LQAGWQKQLNHCTIALFNSIFAIKMSAQSIGEKCNSKKLDVGHLINQQFDLCDGACGKRMLK
jgi:hypothetical protein